MSLNRLHINTIRLCLNALLTHCVLSNLEISFGVPWRNCVKSSVLTQSQDGNE